MMPRRGVQLGCLLFTTGVAICMGTLFAHAHHAAEIETVIWETSLSHPPYERLNPDGSMGGLAVEMARALLRQTPYQLIFQKEEDMPAVPPSGTDAVISMGFESVAYQAQAVFSDPLFDCLWIVYSTPDITQRLSWKELDGFRLGLVGQQHPYYRLLQESYTNIRRFPEPEDAMRALAAGDIDLWLTEKLTGYAALLSQNELSNVRHHGELDITDTVVLVLNPDTYDLLPYINEQIRRLQSTPHYRELIRRYMLDGGHSARIPVFWIVCSGVLTVFLIGAAWWRRRRYRKLEGTLKHITEVYNESKEKLQIAVSNAQNGLFVFKNGSIPFLSARLKSLLIVTEKIPASIEELLTHVIGVSYPSFHGLLIALQDKVIGHTSFDETLCLRLFKEGESEYWVLLCIHAYQHQEGMLYAGYGQDVSKERLLEQRLAFFEDHDYLTGLLNARRLVQLGEQGLAHCVKSEKIFAALFLDLYNFKNINHQYGQRYGDRLLQQTATRIQEVLPDTSLFARMGGDKFIVLLSHMDAEQEAFTIVSRILRSVNAMECRELSLNANVGIAFFPAHSDAVIHLITCAEKAVELAKKKGAGQYAVYQTQDAHPAGE